MKSAPIEPLAVDIATAAKLLSISTRSIHRLVERGELKAVGLVRKRLIPRWSLERYLAGR